MPKWFVLAEKCSSRHIVNKPEEQVLCCIYLLLVMRFGAWLWNICFCFCWLDPEKCTSGSDFIIWGGKKTNFGLYIIFLYLENSVHKFLKCFLLSFETFLQSAPQQSGWQKSIQWPHRTFYYLLQNPTLYQCYIRLQTANKKPSRSCFLF